MAGVVVVGGGATLAATALSAVVVGGAVALGIAGLLALARRPRRRPIPDAVVIAQPLPGYGYGRRRRSTDGNPGALENLMELIREEDVSGCGRRLVCELAGVEDHKTLTVEELSILNLVGPPVKPGHGVLPKGAIGEFKAVRGFGENGGNCGHVFSSCPLNGSQIMQVVMAYLP